MTFDDLKQMEGQIIDYYEVKGNSIKAKKGKISIHRNYFTGNKIIDIIELKLVDKLGRCQEHLCNTIYYKVGHITDSTVYDFNNIKLYLDKEEAYKYVIENLRKQRQNINRKMLKVQMELYGKKISIESEG